MTISLSTRSSSARLRATLLCATLTTGVFSVASAPARADSSATKAAKFASGPGVILYLASSVALPLIDGDEHATQHSLRTADAILTSSIITEGLKRVFREKRPDNNERNSFPSGHATAAFAAATMASYYHPRQSALWYTGATLIALSRLQLHRHYVQDVVAGGLIGYGVARFEIKQPHGLLLSPFIKADEGSDNRHRMGFALSGNF